MNTGKDLIVITGVAGFLGSHLAEHYLSNDYFVVGLDDFSTGSQNNISLLEKIDRKRFVFLKYDVTLPFELQIEKILKNNEVSKLKYIFHFASPASPIHYQRRSIETLWVNSVGLDNSMKLADKYGARVIFASTSEVYGDPEVHPQHEKYFGNVNSFGPRSCYDESKRFGEALIFSHNLKFDTKHGLVRIFNTYGPRMNLGDGRVIINFLVQALTDQPLTIYGNGKQTRSFCYVTDLLTGIIRYADSSLTEPVNLGNNTEFTLLELVQVICDLLPGKKIKITHLPSAIDDPQQRKPNLEKAFSLLGGWMPTIELKDGLIEMINWLQTELK